MEIRRKQTGARGLRLEEKQGVSYLTFPLLTGSGTVKHLVSTRLGGVSEGYLGSLNLSFHRGDRIESVEENYRRLAAVLDCRPRDFVCTDQTHTTNVRLVTEADAGKGVTRPKDYTEVDALITDRPGIVLAAFYADCVPLLFVDPVKRAVGLAHSGWRGTVAGIGAKTLQAMEAAFGSRPEDILAAIGPSICGDCYEVGEEVAREFDPSAILAEREQETDGKKAGIPLGGAPGTDGEQEAEAKKAGIPLGRESETAAVPCPTRTVRRRGNGKYSLDLWNANTRILLAAGILSEHLAVTDICTCCNPKLLYSHRASAGKRGNFGAFLGLLSS